MNLLTCKGVSPVKVHISEDMEGVSGVVGRHQVLQASGALPEVLETAHITSTPLVKGVMGSVY